MGRLISVIAVAVVLGVGFIVAQEIKPRPNPDSAALGSTGHDRADDESVITWSSSALHFYVLPGDIKTRTVSFTSRVALPQATIETTSDIASSVKTSPTSILNLAPGKAQPVQFQVSLPSGGTGTKGTGERVIEGSVRIRLANTTNNSGDRDEEVSGRVLSGDLSMVVTVAPPPGPGAAGITTLAGIDSDGDGVRDDVERYIILTFPQSAKTRSALSQAAIALQSEVINTGNYGLAVHDATDCVGSTLMSGPADVAGGRHVLDVYNALKGAVLNTPERVRAFLAADGQLGASITPSTPWASKSSRCAINPSSFPN